jgi:hypothetical protein
MRRIATRDGRRFERFARDGWRGFARRAPLLAALPVSLEEGAAPERPRIETADGAWRIVYPRLSARRVRSLWACANTLAARGLAPSPLLIASRSDRTLLLLERGAGARAWAEAAAGPARLRAAARLLDELTVLGELRETLGREALAIVPTAAGGARAQLLAPHAFTFAGRAAGAGSRARAEGLRAALAAPTV